MKQEIKGKDPKQTIRRYNSDVLRIKVEFLSGSPIYLSRNDSIYEDLDNEMAQDIEEFDKSYKIRNLNLRILNFITMIGTAGFTISTIQAYSIMKANGGNELHCGILAAGVAALGIANLKIHNNIEYNKKIHLYRENSSLFNDSSLVEDVRCLEQFPQASTITPNNVDDYSYKELVLFKDKIDKAKHFQKSLQKKED